jgi:hypothetical protein
MHDSCIYVDTYCMYFRILLRVQDLLRLLCTKVLSYDSTFVLSYEIKQRSTTLASYVVHTVRLLPELAFFE